MQKASSEKSKSSKGSAKKAAGDAQSPNLIDGSNPQGDGPKMDEKKVDNGKVLPGVPESRVDDTQNKADEGENIFSADAAMTKIQGSASEGTGTSISSQLQKIIAKELVAPSMKGRIDLQSVPMREYLEQTVIPIVHQGMLALARERPESPIEYLAAYFLKHKNKYQFNSDAQPDLEKEETVPPGRTLNETPQDAN